MVRSKALAYWAVDSGQSVKLVQLLLPLNERVNTCINYCTRTSTIHVREQVAPVS